MDKKFLSQSVQHNSAMMIKCLDKVKIDYAKRLCLYHAKDVMKSAEKMNFLQKPKISPA